MKKIAICISGEIRTGVELFPIFKKFFKDVEYDVFIHTWRTEDNIETFEKICELYEPKNVIFEKHKIQKHGMLNTNSMMYSIMRANDLRRDYEENNGLYYDCVVRYRFDILFKEGMYFPMNDFSKRRVFCHSLSRGEINTDFEMAGMNEVIFWGNSEVMNILSDCYRYYNYYYVQNHEEVNKSINYDLSPQNLFYHLLIKFNIRPVYIKISDKIPFLIFTLWREKLKDLNPYENYEYIDQYYLSTK